MKPKTILILTIITVTMITASILFASYGPYQNAFNAGEVSGLVKYRVDLAQYRSACQTVENFAVTPQGSAIRRPGTQYIADSNDVSSVRLIPFTYSTSDAYALEFGDGYIEFFRTVDGTPGQIEAP